MKVSFGIPEPKNIVSSRWSLASWARGRQPKLSGKCRQGNSRNPKSTCGFFLEATSLKVPIREPKKRHPSLISPPEKAFFGLMTFSTNSQGWGRPIQASPAQVGAFLALLTSLGWRTLWQHISLWGGPSLWPSLPQLTCFGAVTDTTKKGLNMEYK